MAYKRNIDRLPIIPAGAKEHNVTCHYCIVGCGYKAYTWPLKTQGTTDSNWLGEDLSKQGCGNRRVVLALDVQHRQAERQRRASSNQA